MADQKNPNQQVQTHQNPNGSEHQNPFLRNQFPPRIPTTLPPLQNRRYLQNPNPPNHPFTVPTPETLQFLNRLVPDESVSSHNNGLIDASAFSKPFQDHQSLEAAFQRINISGPQLYSSQLADDDYNYFLRNCKGLSHPVSYEQQYHLLQQQIQQQQLVLNYLNYLRSVSTGLGFTRSDGTYRSIQNTFPINTHWSNNQEIDASSWEEHGGGYGYSYPSNGVTFDSDSPRNRPSRSNNYPLESPNVNALLALYNRQKSQSRKYSCLEQLRGKVASAARDEESCRFLQKTLDDRSAEQIEMIFVEVKDQLHDLILDSCANHLVQKLFEVSSEGQMRLLVLALIRNKQRLVEICVHPHGTRALQKMIENIKVSEQRALLISVLRPVAVALSKNQNGHHVIMQLLIYFSGEDCKYVMEEIAESCIDVAMDKSGCCVLQQAVSRARGEIQETLLTKIASNALELSEHPYGNYVVQHVIGMNVARAKASIVERLRKHYVALSMNKYGSNVVEKCLKECSEESASKIITELMHSPTFLGVLQDPYGNYVAQTAIMVAKGDLFRTLVGVIQIHYPQLHSHIHGKKVLETAIRVSRQYHP